MLMTIPSPAEHFGSLNAMYWKDWAIPLGTGNTTLAHTLPCIGEQIVGSVECGNNHRVFIISIIVVVVVDKEILRQPCDQIIKPIFFRTGRVDVKRDAMKCREGSCLEV